jgi:formylglycine-generating enzyme required for sulfatase activity
MVVALAVIAVLGGRTIRLEGLRQQAIALNPLTPIAASGAPSTLFMDKYEVSNQQYQLCLDAGGAGCTKPDVALGAPDHPVSSVTPYQAAAFCRWVGQRLPSRDEWLLAAIALGTASERRWSWGDNPPTADLANVGLKEPMPTDTVSVSDDFYRTSDTPDGLRHMVGNVREWTTTIDPTTCPAGTTCPANWDGTSTLPQDVKLYALGFSFRSVVYPESPPKDDQASFIGTFDHVGFRCASG